MASERWRSAPPPPLPPPPPPPPPSSLQPPPRPPPIPFRSKPVAPSNHLPITSYRHRFLLLLNSHNVVIVSGDPGTGKTTQLPQFVYHNGWCDGGRTMLISMTKGAVVAETAKRVAYEISEVSESVQHSIESQSPSANIGSPSCPVGVSTTHFSSVSTSASSPSLHFVQDTLLLQYLTVNPRLDGVSVIMIDDLDDRSLASEVIIALLKRILRHRRDLRVILCSRDVPGLSAFFDCDAMTVDRPATSDSSHRAAIRDDVDEEDIPMSSLSAVLNVTGMRSVIVTKFLASATSNYFDAALETVLHLHAETVLGDMIVYLPSIEDCVRLCSELTTLVSRNEGVGWGGLVLLPLRLHGGLSTDEIDMVTTPLMSPVRHRKIIAATNYADATSLLTTITTLAIVIDTGLIKRTVYSPSSDVYSVVTVPISISVAERRAAMVGRVGPGFVYRLYPMSSFLKEHTDVSKNMSLVTAPSILSEDLTGLVLLSSRFGISNPLTFDWLTPPRFDSISRALSKLYALNMVDDDGKINENGKFWMILSSLLSIPSLSPCIELGALLLSACDARFDLCCGDDAVTLIAILISTLDGNLYIAKQKSKNRKRNKDDANEEDSEEEFDGNFATDISKRPFASYCGDLISMVNTFYAWLKAGRNRHWGGRMGVSFTVLTRIDHLKKRIISIITHLGKGNASSVANRIMKSISSSVSKSNGESLSQAIAAAYCQNIAIRSSDYEPYSSSQQRRPSPCYYSILSNQKLYLHPSSVLGHAPPPMVVYRTVVTTSRPFMIDVTVVEEAWCRRVAPCLFVSEKDLLRRMNQSPADDQSNVSDGSTLHFRKRPKK